MCADYEPKAPGAHRPRRRPPKARQPHEPCGERAQEQAERRERHAAEWRERSAAQQCTAALEKAAKKQQQAKEGNAQIAMSNTALLRLL